MAETYGRQLSLSAGKCVLLPSKFERHRDVFERCHSRQQMEGLQDDADTTASSDSQLVLIEPSEIKTGNTHAATTRPFHPRQDCHER